MRTVKHYWAEALEICTEALADKSVFDYLSGKLIEPSAELTIIVNDLRLNNSDEIKKLDASFRAGMAKIKTKIETESKRLDELKGLMLL